MPPVITNSFLTTAAVESDTNVNVSQEATTTFKSFVAD